MKKEILRLIPKNKKFDLTDLINKCLDLKIVYMKYLVILGLI